MIAFRLPSIGRLLSLARLAFGLVLVPLSAPAAWESEMAAFAAADAAQPPPENVIVFTGSSSIAGWSGLAAAFPGYPVLNRGFGGSQMNDVLTHYGSLVTPYASPLIVLYEGDNDIQAGEAPSAVFAEYVAFVDRVAADFPETDIIIIAVKPSPSRVTKMAPMAELNNLLRDLCTARPNLRFADVFTPMLSATGQPRPELFNSDMLHLNAAGYAIWTEVLTPLLALAPFPGDHTFLLDFGGPDDPAPAGWNTVSVDLGTTPGATLPALVNAAGGTSTASLVIDQPFNALNDAGTTAASIFPAEVTGDSLYGNTGSFNDKSNIFPQFRLTGLDPELRYRLTFYASRTGVAGNRETLYSVAGANAGTGLLDAAENINGLATVDGMTPDAEGSLTVSLSAGPGNDSPYSFTYLGALKVDGVAPPPPDTTAPLLLSAAARSGMVIELTFNEVLDLDSVTPVGNYSINGGAVGVESATLLAGGRVASLTLFESVAGTVSIAVSNLADPSGNAVAPGTGLDLEIPVPSAAAMLFDFGAAATPTTAADDSLHAWNNVTTSVGSSDTGALATLVTTANQPTTASLRMVRRFNGANTNGTTGSPSWPGRASGDTLFGNTASFNNLSDIFPAFRLTGLDPAQTYDFVFYASRMGANDNRETRYTLEGANKVITHLQVAGNVNESAAAHGLRPTPEGEITVSISPGDANNNANRFTYLGIMQVAPAPPLTMLPPQLTGTHINLFWNGTGQLEHADSPAGPWTAILPSPTPPYADALLPSGRRFYRVRAFQP